MSPEQLRGLAQEMEAATSPPIVPQSSSVLPTPDTKEAKDSLDSVDKMSDLENDCRLEELVPRGAWEAVQDVSSLERAIADLEYRDNELRSDHRVHLWPLPTFTSAPL